jgi:hypothetical protein
MSGLDDTSFTLKSVTAAYTATATDFFIYCNPSGGAFTVTLPAGSSSIPGRVYGVASTGTTNAVTVAPASGTIDGGANASLASGAVHAKWFITDGTNWFTIVTG